MKNPGRTGKGHPVLSHRPSLLRDRVAWSSPYCDTSSRPQPRKNFWAPPHERRRFPHHHLSLSSPFLQTPQSPAPPIPPYSRVLRPAALQWPRRAPPLSPPRSSSRTSRGYVNFAPFTYLYCTWCADGFSTCSFWWWLRKVKREEEMGMDPDKYREVFDLAQRGARAFRDGHFDEVSS